MDKDREPMPSTSGTQPQHEAPMEVETPMRDEGFGGNLEQNIICKGMFWLFLRNLAILQNLKVVYLTTHQWAKYHLWINRFKNHHKLYRHQLTVTMIWITLAGHLQWAVLGNDCFQKKYTSAVA